MAYITFDIAHQISTYIYGKERKKEVRTHQVAVAISASG